MLNIERARDALQSIPHDLPRDDWHRIGRAAIAAGLGIDDLVAWSEGAANFKSEQDVRAAFKGITPDGGTSEKTLFKTALQNGWSDPGREQTDRASARSAQPPRKPAQTPQKHQRLSDWGRAFWRDCKPLSGVATQYLQSRHCVIPPKDGHLRYHPAAKHPSGHTGPALVALVTDVLTCEPLSLHRTWITTTGKADLVTPRLPLANHALKGGCIRLWPDDAVTYGLGIAEGIETALSLAHAYQPVWSLIDAGHLAQFPVLPGIESLVIAQDQDQAGKSAASICARRWAEAGKEVLLTRQAENDLNDLLKEAA